MKPEFKTRVFVSGMGLVSAAGANPETNWQAAYEQHSAIKNGLGRIENISEERKALEISLISLKQSFQESGWKKLNEEDGFIFATTTSYTSSWDHTYLKRNESPEALKSFEEAFKRERIGALLEEISDAIFFKGKRLLLSTACAASTHALSLAYDWIRSGRVKRCLVGATETLSLLTIEGFKSFKLLTNEVAKPFDEKRSGVNLSEASAFICLESNPENALAEIVGTGMSSDAFHMTAPHPEGKGSYLAMKGALDRAGLSEKKLSWVHAHGTGSDLNDKAEGIAIQTILKDEKVPVSSTKAIHGHALGATGLMETVLAVKSMEKNILLPNANFNVLDPRLRLNILKSPLETPINYILKNTMGFGGANGAVVLKNVRQG